MTKNRVIVAIMSDSHSGSAFGLCNPEVELNSESGSKQLPELSEGQQYLWNDVYIPDVDNIKRLAGKDALMLLHLGDVTQGARFPGELMAGDSVANQILIAESLFEPWLSFKNLKGIRFAKGTGVHTFGAGSGEVIVGHLLDRRIDTKITYHGCVDVNGCKIDYAHHGPSTGKYNWTRGNVARSYLRDMMLGSMLNNFAPSDVLVRGHYHSYVKEFLAINGIESWLVVCPSLCLLSEYVVKVTQSGFNACNGLIALEIIDGKLYKIHSFIHQLNLRLEETFGNQADKPA